MHQVVHSVVMGSSHHDAVMRTTLTIDDDLYRTLEETARRERRSLRGIIEDALRASLRGSAPSRYEPYVHHSALLPGVDVRRLNELASEVEDERTIARLSR